MPGINLKDEELTEEVENLILDKQLEIKKQKKIKISKAQVIVLLLKQAYCKKDG